MNFKTIVIFLLAIPFVKSKSFTIVADTTISMREEIDILKTNIASILNNKISDIENYILVPFNDPDVGPPLISKSAYGLVEFLNAIEVSGGDDCPENSLAAIEKALVSSKPKSYIFVFTDAQAKDNRKLDSIQNLCQRSGSLVAIFLSGKCIDDNSNINENVYYDIVKTCSGSVFDLDLKNLRQAFQYIKEIVSIDWTAVRTYNEFEERKGFTFMVDSYTKDVLITVAGDTIEITITNIYGDSPTIHRIMETKHSVVIRLIVPKPGEYTVEVSCQGPAVTTIYTRKHLAFKCGFSTHFPRTLKETSSSPMPGTSNYILIDLSEHPELAHKTLKIRMSDSDNEQWLQIQTLDSYRSVAQMFFEPGKSFVIMITARSTVTNEEIQSVGIILEPQRQVSTTSWTKAIVESIEPESAIVDYQNKFTLYCKIRGYPKPDIWWQDSDGNKIRSETTLLEIPSLYISYANIDNATKNDTITCNSKNAKGEGSLSMDLFIRRPFMFEVTTTPTDTTIKFNEEGQLYCGVNAYPEAKIKWFHNDTEVKDGFNIEIVENSLIIKHMTLEDTGDYSCNINNGVESRTFGAKVKISGLQAPEIKVENSNILLAPGDYTEIACSILKGTPKPKISWSYRCVDCFEFLGAPDGVVVKDSSLKIASAKPEVAGFYRCEAENVLGEDTKEVVVSVEYLPKIKNQDADLSVKEDDMVKLECDVDAYPKASVHWDLYQDDVIISFDHRHSTDDRNTHRFIARANDSGSYHCIAENQRGKAIRTVTLNVLVAPYIEVPELETITARAGSTVPLTCNVSYGNPVPSTKWEFISMNSSTQLITRAHSMGRLNLNIDKISKRHEGFYQCVAENVVGLDSIKIYVKVI